MFLIDNIKNFALAKGQNQAFLRLVDMKNGRKRAFSGHSTQMLCG